jgi:uncharacterized damage-inducible protein DinB
MTERLPEVWLRGPVHGVPLALQPVAHALLQSVEDAEAAAAGLDAARLQARPGGAASVAFHLVHMAGSLDRLLTYARGESLSAAQRDALAAEPEPIAGATAGALVELLRAQVERALAQLRATDPATLDEARAVGRAGLPSSVRGLLCHAGEHTLRHAGQLITTARIVGAATPVATIGYEAATVDAFLEALRRARVELLIDVRAVASSRRPGFSKTRLAAHLADAGIDYLHLRGLGTPAEGRAAARAGRHDEMRRIFAARLATAEAVDDLGTLADIVQGGRRVCLLCFEADPAHCHRSLVADALGRTLPIEVEHLRPSLHEEDSCVS